MKPLTFLCARTGNKIDTGLDLDARRFASLPRETTELSCPHCAGPHLLAGVSAWLGELRLDQGWMLRTAMGEPRISPFLAALLSFALMFGAVAAMSELDFGSPLNLLAELGNGEWVELLQRAAREIGRRGGHGDDPDGNEVSQKASARTQTGRDCILGGGASSRWCGCSTMENVMTRLCLLACLTLAGSILLQHDIAAASQVSTNTRVAQDDNSGNAQTPDTAAAPDSGSSDDSKSPPEDKE
jgi:hypothetical protein